MRILLPVCLILYAAPALAQFDLQVMDASGTARTAPAVYDFGTVYTTDSLTVRFRLRNTGNAAITVTTLSVGGTGFSLAGPAVPVTVEAQVALDFTVTFHSADLGGYSAVLRAANVTILLTANVQAGLTWRVEDSPLGAMVNFGSAIRGSTVRRRFTATNESPARLTVPLISLLGGDFAFSAPPPSGTLLGPRESAEFTTEFTAGVAGAHTSVLVLGDRSVVLIGVAVDPPLPRPILTVDLKTVASAQQGLLVVAFDRPSPSAGAGTAVLDFRGSADPTVAFANGTRSVDFPVAAGDERVSVPFQTGTTAGTLIFTVRLGEASDLLAVQIPTLAPSLTQVQAARVAGGLEVRVTGWDNTHSVSQVVFNFYDASGGPIGDAVRVDASAEFTKFYGASDIGGAFAMRAVFPVTGDPSRIASCEVALTDLIGTTRSGRAAFP